MSVLGFVVVLAIGINFGALAAIVWLATRSERRQRTLTLLDPPKEDFRWDRWKR